ncbi:MAG: 3-keto-disaccharide hydrolase [Steroidobacter sp.]
MIRRLCMLACAALSSSAPAFGASADEPSQALAQEWIHLFNGRDLTRWTPKLTHHESGDNFGRTFRVEDGLLKVRYDEYPDGFNTRFGVLFFDTPYSHYRLAVEYRFVGEQAARSPGAWAKRNSGVMIHSQAAATMTKQQDFPLSIEVQLLGGLGDGKARPTANMCSPGAEVVYNGALYPSHCLESSAKTYDGDQWVRLEIIVLGDSLITHIVNGEKVLEYSMSQIGGGMTANIDPAIKQDGQPLAGGYIALQSESHPIDFRKIELLNLQGCMDRKASNYRKYFVRSDKSACRYDADPAMNQ